MAQVEKSTHASGKVTYRVRIRLRSMPDISSSFRTRTQAREWGYKKEAGK